MNSIKAENIWVLSALDKFMADNKNKPEIFIPLFEKKKTIIELLQSMKIDSKKYRAIVVKAYKDQSGDVKKCAEVDLLKCKDGKSDEMVELWFREMIENTGASYQQQKKLYQKYQNLNIANKNVQASTQPTNTSTVKPNGGNQSQIDSLVSFKQLDDLLESNEDNRQYYGKLLQRKQKLLGLVKSKALTAEKYKSTLQLYMSKIDNQQLKSDYKFELDGIQDFHDGNVGAWFKQIIEETSQKLSQQMQKLNKKPSLEKGKPPQSVPVQKEIKRQSIQKSNIPTSSVFDLNALTSFKIFDDSLQNLKKSKQKYRDVLAKKKKFLDLAKKGALTAEKYHSLLVKAIQESKDAEIKEGMEFQLSEINDFHDGNVKEWFKDVIQNTEIILDEQEATLQKLEKGGAANSHEDEEELIMSDEDVQILSDEDDKIAPVQESKKPQPALQPKQIKTQIIKQTPKSSKKGKLEVYPNSIFSLKALDEFMTEFGKDAETFCICFEQKLAIFEKMKTGQINAEKYKKLQEDTLKSTTCEKLKQVVEMDLFDLKDMCDNNVNEWFQNLVNESGDSYEQQQAIYQKFKGGNIKKEEQKRLVKPNIAEVVCFTAVNLLFDESVKTTDIVYYRELLSKRDRLLELVNQKKLIPSKYREINKATFSKTENQFLRTAISNEQKMINTKFEGKEETWFEEIFKALSVPPPELKLPENQEMKKVNSWPVDKKKKYLICRMSPYESMLRYYTKNDMPLKNNKYLLEYDKFKKEDAIKALQQLEKNPQLDIYNVAEQLFPSIDEGIFYGGSLTDLKKKADKLSELFPKEIAAIKDYSTQIKKATNPQNLQNSKKEISKCQENIKYLKSWPNGCLIGFPSIKEQKVEKYNLDIMTHLQKNQIQIEITQIEGISHKDILKIFVADPVHHRFFAEISPGNQKGINTIVKLPVKDMNEIYRGEKGLIWFKIYQKGFFGTSLVGENTVQTGFKRNNILEGNVEVGKAVLTYVLKVQRPTKPFITQITHYELTPFEPFQNDPKVEEELIKKYLTLK